MTAPVTLDGSQGEGGGQVLRSSLALSIATGRPFRMENIRAGRRKPGLARQHLTSVEAAAAVGDAEVEGATLGSTTLAFTPNGCRAGTHHFKVGTAGSTVLVAQAVLPALMYADAPSELVIEGGTHASFAPPFEFLRDAWMPQMNRIGAHLEAEMERPGFFPVGGGRIRVRITPAESPKPLHLIERGKSLSKEARAVVAKLPRDIAQRELDVVAKRLGWPSKALHADEVRDAIGAGNALLLTMEHEHVTEVVVGLGALGVRAEDVARRACREAGRWMKQDAPVGEHLADQLMVPLALGAGGSYRTGPLSAHARTNLDVIAHFLDVPLRVAESDAEAVVHIG